MALRLEESGYIALMTVIIVSALVLLIAISLGLFGISEADLGLGQFQSAQSYYLANACAEEALMKFRNDNSYQGNEDITLADGTCSIGSIEGNGSQYRIIKTTSSFGNKVKKIKIKVLETNPKIVIRLWQQVVDF